MAQQASAAIQNNFTKGLVTEFTGLNFPENAATDCDNVTFTLVGDVTRRGGFDLETNGTSSSQNRVNKAMSSYRWNNVGGDGLTQILVEQIGTLLLFYRSSTATVASPLSTQILLSTVTVSNYTAVGGTYDATAECTYSDGNGYLFVYHPSCDPFYCTYTAGTVTAASIQIKIRDFAGIFENIPVNVRPSTLTAEHQYNLTNQGWTSGNPWLATSATTFSVATGSTVFTVQAGLSGVVNGTRVKIDNNVSSSAPGAPPVGATVALGTVTSYSGTTLTINIDTVVTGYSGYPMTGEIIYPVGSGYLTTWNTAVGNYPSNADIWWYFKNASGVFDPATTAGNIFLSTGNAPRGHYILNAFNQQRSALSGLTGLTDITTSVRPRIGTWFQGRVWYSGVDAQQAAVGDASYYTWTENIYFSQIVNTAADFGSCFQTNDPSSENLFDLLSTDGGVIQIQGIGSIYKLLPTQNGLLVFGANGIKFITGSQGVGFSANDYTIVDVSEIKTISSTSFVVASGVPYFWNEEGIYVVMLPQQQGFGFQVQSLTYSTIDTFYSEIPKSSKKYVRGDYDPINYTLQWVYRDTEAPDVVSRYQFNKVLNYNTANKSFFPYTVDGTVGSVYINSINYVTHPGGSTAPPPGFKYYVSHLTSSPMYNMSFAEEKDFSLYVDWNSIIATNYVSYFITGYQLGGKALTRFQPTYVYVFSRNDEDTTYKIQSIWDYANNPNSGRWSNIQVITISKPNYGMVFRRHKLRGQGLVLQIKVTSSDGQPFDIMGWSMPLQINASV